MTTNEKTTQHRFGMGTLALIVILNSAIVGSGVWWISKIIYTNAPQKIQEIVNLEKAHYQCPMHPSVIQDHPGECPICGMELIEMEEEKNEKIELSETKKDTERKILFYRSPMDPKVTAPTPSKDTMGMDYVPVYSDEMSDSSSSVSGLATINIDPARQQLIGLTTVQVTMGPLGGVWRTVGRVSIDETRIRHINLKVSGFVEHIYVDFIGKAVKKGDPLFAIYSPELLSTQKEYLLAIGMKKSLSKGDTFLHDGDALVNATRRKLMLWDIPKSTIDQIAVTGKTTKTLIFYSPISGVVTKKDIVEGMKLEAGAMPYEIVDLATVWVFADIYESELRFIKKGMPASLTLTAYPNRKFTGKVLFMDPLLNAATRTVKVRLAFSNPHGDLRPEMFGEVVLHGTPRVGLRIPQDAVIDSGTEKIVFVALGNGKFQPKTIQLGEASGKDIEVISGLENGELVVTRANFLIDSESRLRASLAEMSGGNSTKNLERARILPDL